MPLAIVSLYLAVLIISILSNLYVLSLFLIFVGPVLVLFFIALLSNEIQDVIPERQISPLPSEKYPKDLSAMYQHKYPHNPKGALEFHISRKIKEGKTREQAIEELKKKVNS